MPRNREVSQRLNTRPIAPPAANTTTASVINWRIKRPRPAPSARRTAISRRRPAARASIIPATLTQAMRSTRPTMTINSPMNPAMMLTRPGTSADRATTIPLSR